MAWNAQAFSLARTLQQQQQSQQQVRAATERRYNPSTAPYNETANAGGSRLPGRPAGFRPDESTTLAEQMAWARDPLDTMVGPISEDELGGRARGLNDIARGEVRDVLLAKEGAPVKRAEMHGTAPSPFMSDAQAASSAPRTSFALRAVPQAVPRAGRGGTMRGVGAAATWAEQEEQHEASWRASVRAAGGEKGEKERGAAWPTSDTSLSLLDYAPRSRIARGDGSGSGSEGGGEAASWGGAATRGAAGPSEHALRVAANGMADFDEYRGAYPGGDIAAGLPRRQDLGMMVAHASQTQGWRSLVAPADAGPSVAQAGRAGAEPGHQSGRGVAGSGLARAAALARQGDDVRWSDGKFGHGDGVDAQFVGVSVNPYSGVEYDEYENEAPAPTGDYRQRDSAMQRQFESVMGGYAPGRPQLKKVQVEGDWTEALPDVDERDAVEYGRARALEYAARAAFWAPHTDAAAWTDGEGYASLPARGAPVNRVGLNDAVRFPALPALHLHAGLAANPMTGGGAQPGADGSGLPDGPAAPAAIAVRLKRAPVVSVRAALGDGAGAEGAAAPAQDPHTHALSDRNRALAALGRAHAALGGGAGAEGAAAPAQDPHTHALSDRNRALAALGRAHAALGGGAGAEGAAAPAQDPHTHALSDRNRALAALGRAHAALGGGAGAEGAAAPAQDPLSRALSSRNGVLAALGSTFAALTSAAAGAGPVAPPAAFPPALRAAAKNPLLLGAAMVDAGLTGPSGAGLGNHGAGPGSGADAVFRRTARADARARAVGDVGMALVTRAGDGDGGGSGAGPGLPPELHDLRPQEREMLTLALGRAILNLADGVAATGGGAARAAPEDWAAPQSGDRGARARAAPAWAAATSAYWASVVAAVDAGAQPAADPVARALSTRDDLLRALGAAFLSVSTAAAPDGAAGPAAPPAVLSPALRAAAANPLLLGAAMVDAGLVGGPSGAGLGDHAEFKRTARADLRAMGIGDVGMALVTRAGDGGGGGGGGGGPGLPPEVLDLPPQDRDLLTLALGRALLHLTDGALHAAGGGGPVAPAASFAAVRRAPAFVDALGRLALQLAGDAVGPVAAPGDWDAPQRGGRSAPGRSEVAWARDVGSRLAGVCAQAEGLSTAGLQDADAPKKRKLAAYAAAIAHRLEGVHAALPQDGSGGAGTAGLTAFTRTNRARKDAPNLRGSAPSKIIDGVDGIAVATERFQRWALRAHTNAPVAGALNSDDAQAVPPTREREWTRRGQRFGGQAVSTRTDHYASGGAASGGGVGTADYTEIDSKFFEGAFGADEQ
jgi:hypothetical protein